VIPANPLGALAAAFDNRAYLEVVRGKKKGTKIPLKFNPTEFLLAKQNTFAEIAIPGLVAPPIQYVRGASEKLTFDALVDTSDTLEDVREKYVKEVRSLLDIDAQLHAPPVVMFVWNKTQFTGVLESLNVTYTLFDEQGKPLRAKLGIALKEFTTVEEQAKKFPKESADVEKSYVVRRGDTLSGIAEVAFGDGRMWRAIARANRLVDPRRLAPGMVLTIPKVT
jgi:nucleoid-associated protein YgaU